MNLQWLSAPLAATMAAITIPSLVLLYFLKLRRREVPVSSTLLWQRAVEDLQVNAPFQRLRRNILLLLQLLVLAAMLLALARPVKAWRGEVGKRYVLLIDRSASMSATDVAPSRLEEAKRRATEFVRSMQRPSWSANEIQSDQAMVVAFADTAEVVVPFTSDQRGLAAGIARIESMPGRSNLAGAVTLARAFATPTEVEGMGRISVELPHMLLYSDGRIRDADAVVVREDELELVRIGESADNVALTALEATRSYEQPNLVGVFGQFANFGDEAKEMDVTLSFNGDVRSVKTVRVPARAAPGGDAPGATASLSGSAPSRSTVGQANRGTPGQAGVVFEADLPGSGVVEVRAAAADALAADDAGWVVLPPPRSARVLLVTAGNAPLEMALKSMSLEELEIRSPEEVEGFSAAQLQARFPADITVLDRTTVPRVPGMHYLCFGDPPPLEGVAGGGAGGEATVLEWEPRHPVLMNVDLTELYIQKHVRLELPADAVVLAEGPDGPLLALAYDGGSRYLLVPFDVLETNWPFDPGWVMFVVNAIRFLSADESGGAGTLRPSDALEVRLTPGAASADVLLPDGSRASVELDANGRLYYAPLSQLGVYQVSETGSDESRQFAVNLLDEQESNLEPAADLQLASGEVPDLSRAGATRPNQQFWPYLALVGMAFLLGEWYVYNRKVQI